MNQQEVIYTIALMHVNYFHMADALRLYQEVGSATEIFAQRHNLRDILPEASPRLCEAMEHCDESIRRAETEIAYDVEHGISPICFNDDRYPQRLRECDDAPLVLFYKGVAELNQLHVINIVGTRHCTAYGKELTRRFIADLRLLCPDVLVVSGLAYGIDICSHKAALANGMQTVGVLAHGLDDLYPSHHRDTAEKMLEQGGLLTEFLTQTTPEKMNFVRRNRIVAGISDACIVVESKIKGGSLITAELSRDYNRDVFAFPGHVGAPYSEGCNHLIRDNRAALITSADDFVKAMGWQQEQLRREARQQGLERQLFPELSEDEQRIVEALQQANDMQVNMLSVRTNIPIQQLSSQLFSLEMKGVVKPLAGGIYHLMT